MKRFFLLLALFVTPFTGFADECFKKDGVEFAYSLSSDGESMDMEITGEVRVGGTDVSVSDEITLSKVSVQGKYTAKFSRGNDNFYKIDFTISNTGNPKVDLRSKKRRSVVKGTLKPCR